MTMTKEDKAALKAFEADLRDMHPSEVRRQLQEVTEEIESLTEWQEALAAKLRCWG